VLRHEAGAGQGSLTQVGTGQGRTRQLNALALADAAVAAALVAGRVDLAAPAAPRAGRHLQAAAAAAHSSQGAGPRQVSAAAGAFASSSPWQLRHVIGSAPTPEQAPLPPPPSSAPPSLPNRLSSAQPSCHRCCPHPRTYWNTPSGVRLRLHDLAAAAAAAAVWGGGGACPACCPSPRMCRTSPAQPRGGTAVSDRLLLRGVCAAWEGWSLSLSRRRVWWDVEPAMSAAMCATCEGW
jgi:hypothetical protein